jgi:hypothetical protein
MTGAPLKDITHLRRASGGQRANARSSKEPDGSLLTPPEAFWKERNPLQVISVRVAILGRSVVG